MNMTICNEVTNNCSNMAIQHFIHTPYKNDINLYNNKLRDRINHYNSVRKSTVLANKQREV